MLDRVKKMIGAAKGDGADAVEIDDGGAPVPSGGAPAEEHMLDAGSEAQGLRVELAERDRVIATLKQDIERARADEGVRVDELVGAQIERLMSGAAAPVAQLLTQAHLLEVEGKPVQAKDVLVVSKRIVRALEDGGLALVGSVGEEVGFDPNLHQPLNSRAPLSDGDRVVVRIVGASYRGRVLCKASVEKSEG